LNGIAHFREQRTIESREIVAGRQRAVVAVAGHVVALDVWRADRARIRILAVKRALYVRCFERRRLRDGDTAPRGDGSD